MSGITDAMDQLVEAIRDRVEYTVPSLPPPPSLPPSLGRPIDGIQKAVKTVQDIMEKKVIEKPLLGELAINRCVIDQMRSSLHGSKLEVTVLRSALSVTRSSSSREDVALYHRTKYVSNGKISGAVYSQEKGLSPVWMHTCLRRLLDWVNLASQYSQEKGLTRVDAHVLS